MIIRTHRQEITNEVSLKDLARRVDCHESQIGNFEHGRWTLPKGRREPLVLGLGVSTLEIMNEYGSYLCVYEEKINPVRTHRVKGDERYGCRDQKNR